MRIFQVFPSALRKSIDILQSLARKRGAPSRARRAGPDNPDNPEIPEIPGIPGIPEIPEEARQWGGRGGSHLRPSALG